MVCACAYHVMVCDSAPNLCLQLFPLLVACEQQNALPIYTGGSRVCFYDLLFLLQACTLVAERGEMIPKLSRDEDGGGILVVHSSPQNIESSVCPRGSLQIVHLSARHSYSVL